MRKLFLKIDVLEFKERCLYFFFYISQDINNVNDRSRPNKKSSTDFFKNVKLSKNHLLRVEDLAKQWKVQFDITIFKMPAFDWQWINILHMTTNGNKDADNIFKFSINRNGLLGRFAFKYWGQRKEIHFSLGTTYHIVVEVFKRRRGTSYGFVISVDDEEIVHKHLKYIQKGLRPQIYKQVKIFTSNPWQPSMPSKVGVVKNLKIHTGRTQTCCKMVFLRIDQTYLTNSFAGTQKNLVGEYTYKGIVNHKPYWIKNDKTNAIWYSKFKEWSIGSILTLGTNGRGIATEHTSANCPTQNQNRWHYFNGVKWKSDLKSHIHVHCKQSFSDFYQENILSKGTSFFIHFHHKSLVNNFNTCIEMCLVLNQYFSSIF